MQTTATRTLSKRETATLERRNRAVAVAREMAATGGADAVQMRLVAQRASMTLATLYRIAPSKEHLLFLVAVQVVGEFNDQLTTAPITGGTRGERVARLLTRCIETVSAEPQLARALALIFGGAYAVDPTAPLFEIDSVRMIDIIRRVAVDGGDPLSDDDEETILLTRLAWSGALSQWLSGSLTIPQAMSLVRRACAMLDLPHTILSSPSS